MVPQLRSPQTVTPPLVAARCSRRPGQPKAATTTGSATTTRSSASSSPATMSLRELCRRHGVTAHSAVVVQARQGDWAEKRQTYRPAPPRRIIEQPRRPCRRPRGRGPRPRHRGHRRGDHEVPGRPPGDREEAHRRRVGRGAGPADHSTRPGDPDRPAPDPFGRPAMISEGRSFAATITSEAIPVDVLQGIIEATRGLATPLPTTPPGWRTTGRSGRTRGREGSGRVPTYRAETWWRGATQPNIVMATARVLSPRPEHRFEVLC